MAAAAFTVDARGLSCPMPVVRSRKGTENVQVGEVIEIIATDKGAMKDIPAWAQMGGHELIESREEGGVYRFYVRRGK